jgi:ATP adenylyltransferase
VNVREPGGAGAGSARPPKKEISMERPLWAPWRMEFIASEKKPTGCIFCEFPAAPEEDDRKNLVVHRTPHSYVCLNRYPYTSGHVMVIPRQHGADLSALAPEAYTELNETLRRTAEVVRATYRPDGMNVGMNLGRSAGAGIVDHLHWHVVPRWAGDNNFMPVIADIRVMVEHLDTTWERIRAGFRAR